MKTIFLVCIFSLFLVSSGCERKKMTTSPQPEIPPDTTGHDFTWQMDVLGDGASSRLSDVCIINENDVWAVGEIYLKDSTGEYVNPPYNVAQWNGQNWELKSIKFRYFYGELYAKAECIFVFNEKDIVISSGGSVMHWDGQSWRSLGYLFDQSTVIGNVYKIWGTSINDFYGIGLQGSIVHYNGTTWQKLETPLGQDGTNLDIQDIWGAKDPATGEYTILAVAANIYTSHDREILKISGTRVEKISDEGIDRSLAGVWFDPGKIYYVVGDGIYSRKSLDLAEIWGGPGLLTVTRYFSHAIRGNHINDVFVVGAFGDVLHYNGNSWRSYREYTALSYGNYCAVAVKGDVIYAVGSESSRAVVLRGKRR